MPEPAAPLLSTLSTTAPASEMPGGSVVSSTPLVAAGAATTATWVGPPAALAVASVTVCASAFTVAGPAATESDTTVLVIGSDSTGSVAGSCVGTMVGQPCAGVTFVVGSSETTAKHPLSSDTTVSVCITGSL